MVALLLDKRRRRCDDQNLKNDGLTYGGAERAQGRGDVVKLLLDANAHVDAQDRFGGAALHLAAENGL